MAEAFFLQRLHAIMVQKKMPFRYSEGHFARIF